MSIIKRKKLKRNTDNEAEGKEEGESEEEGLEEEERDKVDSNLISASLHSMNENDASTKLLKVTAS